MKILPINNIAPNNNFKAKLPPRDVNNLLREINGYDASLVPKLYTLLERLEELPGKQAGFLNEHGWHSLIVNNKSVNCNKFCNNYAALYSSLVNHKDTIVKESRIVRMPESIFEQKWWQNRTRTKSDIKKLADKQVELNQ